MTTACGGGALLSLLFLTGCADRAPAAAEPTPVPSSAAAAPSPDEATRLCQAAAREGRTVLSARLTTVDEVRRERAASGTGVAAAGGPWAERPGDAAAAWCSVRERGSYVVVAVTPGAPEILLIEAKTPLDAGPGGQPAP